MTASLHTKCLEEEHDCYHDWFVSENCREDVYYCRTCGKIYVERWEDKEYRTVHVLPLETSKEAMSKLLTWLK